MSDDRLGGPPIHLPSTQFLAYRHSFPIGQLSPLDSYITSYPFTLRSHITLMIGAARTSETSVDIQLRTRQYVPEDSELHVRILSFLCEIKWTFIPDGKKSRNSKTLIIFNIDHYIFM
jgi:hypothetical protein